VQAIELSSANARIGAQTRRAPEIVERPEGHTTNSAIVWSACDLAPPSGARYWTGDALLIISRLYFPVSFLLVSFAAIYFYLGRPFPFLSDDQSPWLKWSHVLLPATFLVVQLTNRRYGPDYAFAQIVISLAFCDVVAALGPDFVRYLLPVVAVPSAREVTAFSGAFMAAGYLSNVAFDGARGPRWWTAPLIGSLASSVAFALLYYPFAYAGSDVFWGRHMTLHAGILIAVSLLGLIPYWLLRAVIRPLPGYGGY
jgi:uncharacterized PurR-regulated membrane protein YhhQ (DUF165 family)